nr:MFS transporter [Microlunatus panaciterrae]
MGDQVYFLALAWAAVEVSGPATVGLILAAGSVPRLVFLLVGGALADRMSPKRLIILSDTGRTLTLLALAALLTVGSLGPLPLGLVALVFGILDGLFLPAVGALPPRLAPVHLMARIQAARTVIQRLVVLVGAPIAGWLVANRGLASAFWLSAALFAVSVLALALVSLRPGPAEAADEPGATGRRTSMVADIAAGLRSVRSHPVLPSLLAVVALTDLGFSGPLTAGLPILAQHNGWGPAGAGYVLGGFGLGAAATGLTLAVVRQIPRAGLVSYLSLAWMGVAVVLVGMAPSAGLAIAAAVLLGFGSGVFGTLMNALLIITAPPAELGRVMSVLSLASYGGAPISFAVTGLLAGLFGPQLPFYVGGGVVLLAGIAGLTRHRLRSLELATADTG